MKITFVIQIMFRYGEDDFGLPFEYDREGEMENNFSRKEIRNNIAILQQYLRDRKKVY